jgi:hypothetical protein
VSRPDDAHVKPPDRTQARDRDRTQARGRDAALHPRRSALSAGTTFSKVSGDDAATDVDMNDINAYNS